MEPNFRSVAALVLPTRMGIRGGKDEGDGKLRERSL